MEKKNSFYRSGVSLTSNNVWPCRAIVRDLTGRDAARRQLCLTYNDNDEIPDQVRDDSTLGVRDDSTLSVRNDNGQHNTGFTLIELLVVVLIIGILAAVAVPQYQLAVAKSRFANLRTIAQSYISAARVYHLSTGEWPKEMDELSIDYPAGMTPITLPGTKQGTCAQNNEIYCCISKQGSGLCDSVVCGLRDYSLAFEHNHEGCSIDNSTDEIPMCLAKTNNTNAMKMCRSFGPQVGNYGLITPEGVEGGYTFYKLEQ